jgi:uncharacterized protein YkwD
MHAVKPKKALTLWGAAVLAFLLLSMISRVDTAPPPAPDLTPPGHVYLPIVARQPPPTATPIPPDDLAVEQSIASQINQRRQAAGLPLLALDAAITQAARRHCRDMAEQGFTSHTGSDGSSARDRVLEAGYTGTYVGEIIGWGFVGDPDRMIEWWIKSAPHRALILSDTATDFGVGYARDPESDWGHYWTVDLCARQ